MALLINTLSQNQIDSNFGLKCIDEVNTSLQDQIDNLDGETHVDDARNIYISSTSSAVYDPTADYLVSVGTNNTINNTNGTCVSMGSNLTLNRADVSIVIGTDSTVTGTANFQTEEVVNIGILSNINNPSNATVVRNIVNVGNGNDVNDGYNIITLGNNIGHGGLIKNNIILSSDALDTTGGKVPSEGSVIFQSSESTIAGAGGRPSAQPRVNFLGNTLLNPRGQNVGDVVDGLTSFAIPNINGYIRAKYKNIPVLIPFIIDSEGNANVGNPTNITEFP